MKKYIVWGIKFHLLTTAVYESNLWTSRDTLTTHFQTRHACKLIDRMIGV